MTRPKSIEGAVPVEYLDLLLADKCVPEPEAILGGIDFGADVDIKVPTPQELAQEPDIKMLLEVCRNIPRYRYR